MSLGNSRGEVMFDNRADGQGVQEFWTFTCAHCGTVRYVNPGTGQMVRMKVITKITPHEDGKGADYEPSSISWREVGAPEVCRKCMAYLCDNPACHLDCLPVKTGVDLILAQGLEVRPFAVDGRNRYDLRQAYRASPQFQGVSLEQVAQRAIDGLQGGKES